MRTSLTAAVLWAFLGLIHPVNMSISDHPEDLEGSGYDMDGSGSGDWSRQGERKDIEDQPINKDVEILQANTRGGTKNTFHDSSDSSDSTQWATNDAEFVVVANSKSFMERTDIFAAVIAGGLAGVILAAALSGVMIYKWQKTDDEGYILGQQRAPDKDYYISNREEVV